MTGEKPSQYCTLQILERVVYILLSENELCTRVYFCYFLSLAAQSLSQSACSYLYGERNYAVNYKGRIFFRSIYRIFFHHDKS